MSGTVSTRWFWSDWMSDPGLRACSYAARGLWKDMLCIAGSNKAEYGYVSLNGKKLDPEGLAKMTNGTREEVAPLLAELLSKGVYSVDRRGVIYCRRMIRAEKNRRNGRLGGNPNLLKQEEKQKPVQPRPKPLIPEPKPKPEREAPARAGLFAEDDLLPSDWPKDYQDRFWKAYPKHTEKKAALAKLDAVKRGGKVTWAVFLSGVERYARHVVGTEDKFIKQPTTWINKGCWDDEHAPGGSSPTRTTNNGAPSLLVRMMKLQRQQEGFEDGRDAVVENERALPARTDRQH